VPVFSVANSDGRKRILIIEDNIDSQLILNVYLRQLYLINIAEKAESASVFLKIIFSTYSFWILIFQGNYTGKMFLEKFD
jgi:hypothetical protein